MRVSGLTVIVVCIGLALATPSKSCKYWCKADQEHVYYCCPSGKPDNWLGQSVWPVMSSPIFWLGLIGTTIGIHANQKPLHPPEIPAMKKKLCPPMRSVCPRSFDWYDPPSLCDKDEECHPNQKCCFDVCLEHKTCKPAE